MDMLLRDVRHAVRSLARQRGFTLAALATLALGIGANAAMFSIVYGLVLRPLPYPDADAIVRVGQVPTGIPRSTRALNNYSMQLLEEEAESFEHLAAYTPLQADWAVREGSVRLRGTAVSPALFPLLRARPHLGRLFTEDEARDGADQVVLLSYDTWATRFGADPDAVGTVLEIGGVAREVVGVLAEGFYFPSPDNEIWTPLVLPAFEPPAPSSADDRDARTFVFIAVSGLGRLRADVSPEQAEAEAATLLERRGDPLFGGSRGNAEASGMPAFETRVIPLQEEMTAAYRPALLALSGATALVLVIACINVAGLLLARGVSRQRVLAVCAALGAARGRLVRQLLTESVLLGLLGGALGLGAAAAVLRAVPALVPGDVPRLDEVGVGGEVLAFTLGLSALVGLAFGAVPAFQWSRVDLVRVLNEGSAQAAGGFRVLRANRTRAMLAVAQVALALMLLVGAGLLLRSFVAHVTVDRGYDPTNVITARTLNPDARLRPGAMSREAREAVETANQRFQAALLDGAARLSALPATTAVGLSSNVPLAAGGMMQVALSVAGRPAPADPREAPRATVQVASPGWFDVLRVRLRAGRLPTRLDGAAGPGVVVVNETLAREVFGGEPAVGQRLLLGRPWGGGEESWEIVGVVADLLYGNAPTGESEPEMFVPWRQSDRAPVSFFGMSFVSVRTAGDPLAVVPFLREVVTEAHPGATVVDVMTMDARLAAVFVQPRFYAVLVGGFAALALLLAAFGVYGLLSYTVAQRRSEIGIRMALGAARSDIVVLVVRQGALLVAVGTIAGMLGAFLSSRLMEGFLVGVAPRDALTFVAAPLLLVGVALFACWLPSRRATRIDPMEPCGWSRAARASGGHGPRGARSAARIVMVVPVDERSRRVPRSPSRRECWRSR